MKKIKNKGALLCVLAAFVLFAVGGYMYLSYLKEDRAAGQAAAALMKRYETVAAQSTPAEQDTTIMVDGEAMFGTVSIEALGLSMPIYDTLDAEKLKTAPCRYSGSIEEENLVIAGYNYESHFADFKQLLPNEKVVLRDVHGVEHRYNIETVYTVAAEAVVNMKWSDYDLSLFTGNRNGNRRWVVRCKLIENPGSLELLQEETKTQ